MAQAIRSSSQVGGNTGTSLVINLPAGVVNGDVLVLSIFSDALVSFGAPAGWTVLRDISAGGGTQYQLLCKVAAGEPASYTLTAPSGPHSCAVMLAISGAQLVLDGETSRNNPTAINNIPGDPVTTTKTGQIVIWIATRPSIATAGNIQSPTSQVQQQRVNTGGSAVTGQMSMAAAAFGAPGTTTGSFHTGSFSASQTSRSNVSVLTFQDFVASNVPLLFCEA
jgi:hypothetical protein